MPDRQWPTTFIWMPLTFQNRLTRTHIPIRTLTFLELSAKKKINPKSYKHEKSLEFADHFTANTHNWIRRLNEWLSELSYDDYFFLRLSLHQILVRWLGVSVRVSTIRLYNERSNDKWSGSWSCGLCLHSANQNRDPFFCQPLLSILLFCVLRCDTILAFTLLWNSGSKCKRQRTKHTKNITKFGLFRILSICFSLDIS